MRTLLPTLAALSALAFALPAHAAATITNGSFESGTYTLGGDGGVDLAPGSTAITGWTVITNDVAPIGTPNNFTITAQSGNISLDLQSYNDGSPYGGVQQVITTSPGQIYDLSFYVGVQNSSGIGLGPAAVSAAAVGTSQTFTNTLSAPGQQWQQFTFRFTANAPTTTISLSGISTTGGAYIGLDNVSIAEVPEPASLSLLALTSLPLLLRRNRK